MKQNKDISLSEVVAALPPPKQEILEEMHRLALGAGFKPFPSKSAKKEDTYKIEYKKLKKDDPLYILRVYSGKWNIRCKLFHLDSYVNLLYNLSESALQEVLSSKECKGEASGCTVGVKFLAKDKEYELCRHGIHFNELSKEDIASVWGLLQAESAYR